MEHVTVCIGTEDYLFDRYLKKCCGDAEIVRRDAFGPEVRDELLDLDFLSSEKVVVVEKDELGAEPKLLEFLSSGVRLENPLFLRAKKAKENTKLFAWLKKNAKVERFDPLSEPDFLRFLEEEKRDLGLNITPEAFNALPDAFCYGSSKIDLYGVHGYLEMLSWLQEARKEDVDALVSISSERGAFDLLRYLQKGSADKLMKALSEYDGDPLAVLGAFSWAFRIAVKLEHFSAKEVGVWPGTLNKISGLLKLPPLCRERCFYESVRGMELIKAGYPAKEAVSLTVSKICRLMSGNEN